MKNQTALVSKWKPASINNLIVFILSISLFYKFSDLEFRVLAKDDILLLLQEKERVVWLKRRAVRIDTVYKRKNQKVKPVNFGESDNTKPGGYTD